MLGQSAETKTPNGGRLSATRPRSSNDRKVGKFAGAPPRPGPSWSRRRRSRELPPDRCSSQQPVVLAPDSVGVAGAGGATAQSAGRVAVVSDGDDRQGERRLVNGERQQQVPVVQGAYRLIEAGAEGGRSVGDGSGVGEVRLERLAGIELVGPQRWQLPAGDAELRGSVVDHDPSEDGVHVGTLLEGPHDSLEPQRIHLVVVVGVGDDLASRLVDPAVAGCTGTVSRRGEQSDSVVPKFLPGPPQRPPRCRRRPRSPRRCGRPAPRLIRPSAARRRRGRGSGRPP